MAAERFETFMAQSFARFDKLANEVRQGDINHVSSVIPRLVQLSLGKSSRSERAHFARYTHKNE